MEISYAVYFVVVALISGFSLGTIYESWTNDRQRERDRRRVAREAEEQKLRDLRLELDQAKRDIRLLQREGFARQLRLAVINDSRERGTVLR